MRRLLEGNIRNQSEVQGCLHSWCRGEGFWIGVQRQLQKINHLHLRSPQGAAEEQDQEGEQAQLHPFAAGDLTRLQQHLRGPREPGGHLQGVLLGEEEGGGEDRFQLVEELDVEQQGGSVKQHRKVHHQDLLHCMIHPNYIFANVV